MENTSLNRKRIIEPSEISDTICNGAIQLTSYEKERMSYGELSDFHEGLPDGHGGKKNGKVRLVRDLKTNEVKFEILLEKEKVQIPKFIEIDGKKKVLATEELEDLKNGKTICLQETPKDDLFIKIDKDTHDIVISTGKQLGIPTELGGYTLTPQDKANMEMGKPIGTRLFEGAKKGEYFLANPMLTEDKMAMVWKDVRMVKENEVEKYRAEYNTPPTPSVNNEIENTVQQTVASDILNNKEDVLLNAIIKRDANEVADIINKGHSIKQEHFDAIKKVEGEIYQEKWNTSYSEDPETRHREGVVNTKNEESLEKIKGLLNKQTLSQEKSTELNPNLKDAVDKKDFGALRTIKESGHKPTEKDIAYIKENEALTREDKIAALTTIGAGNEINKEDEQKKEFYQAVDEKNDSKLKDLTNKGFKPEEKEVEYLVNHKAANMDEKKDMLSHLNIAPDKKQEADIKIGKIDEKFKEDKKVEAEKPKDKTNRHKMERLVTTGVGDM